MSLQSSVNATVSRKINQPIAIRGIGVVSSFGVGLAAFTSGIEQTGKNSNSYTIEPEYPSRANRRTDFDEIKYLGHKGIANLDRLSKLSILACTEALEGVTVSKDRTGVVLGTSGGSFESISDFVRSTYEAIAPHKVSPIKFPNTVMNCAASQCAIRFGLKGVNSTVCGGDMSGLLALNYATRSLRLGHADVLIVGAVEECCKYTAWSHQQLTEESSRMSDGCALLTLGGDIDGALGEILGVRYCRAENGTEGELRRAKSINRLIKDCGLTNDDIDWCSISTEGRFGELEMQAIKLSGCANHAEFIPPKAEQFLGNTHSASFSFQLAAALVTAPKGIGLLTMGADKNQFGHVIVRKN